jgi:hypothetical protein
MASKVSPLVITMSGDRQGIRQIPAFLALWLFLSDLQMYGPPQDCKGKFGRKDKSAQMYSAFEWRSSLLAMMSCARVCPYKSVGRERPFAGSGCGHAVVTVLSSSLLLCRLRWEILIEVVCFHFPRVTPRRAYSRCRWRARPRRSVRACWPWQRQQRSSALWSRVHQATLRSVHGRA